MCCLEKADEAATKRDFAAFKSNWRQQYNEKDISVPTGICVKCRIRLHAKPGEGRNRPKLKIGNYELLLSGTRFA